MAGMIKRLLVLLLISSLLFSFAGCGMSIVRYYYRRNEIKNIAEDMMQCVAEKDVDALFEYFDQNNKENGEEQLKEQIQQVFDYIDGNIVSYDEYSEGGGAEANNFGDIGLYTRNPQYQRVLTDSQKKYKIIFFYTHIDEEHPELIGLNIIRVFDLSKEHEYLDAGSDK